MGDERMTSTQGLLLTHLSALIGGMGLGFAFGVWLFLEPVQASEVKYRLKAERWMPSVRSNTYSDERQWDIRCIGSVKDCGQPTSIPEPGTLLLIGLGGGALAWMRRRA